MLIYILFSLCSLEELFLCLNDYKTVSCSPVCCHSLKLLHITDNNLKDWTEIRKLGVMFPSLDTLVLANNHLTTIEDSEDSLARLFPNLRSISLHKSGEALNKYVLLNCTCCSFLPRLDTQTLFLGTLLWMSHWKWHNLVNMVMRRHKSLDCAPAQMYLFWFCHLLLNQALLFITQQA